jgi:hypothetical protein
MSARASTDLSDPQCIATTQSACNELLGITAWVNGKPCTGSSLEACRPEIKGACCYSLIKPDCEYPENCHITRCTAGVTWQACAEASDSRRSAYKFAAGVTTCATDTCPPLEM